MRKEKICQLYTINNKNLIRGSTRGTSTHVQKFLMLEK